jgi:hypothetical protein
VAIVLLAVIGMSCTDARPIASLRAMSEGTMYYPDSKVVKEVATPQVDSPDGKSGASFGHLMGANASPEEIVAFYDRELRARGWRPIDAVTGTGSLSQAAWTNGQADFTLFVSRPERLTRDIQQALEGYSVEYDARVEQIYPPPSASQP